ncbi:fimbrial protein [Pantoea sp. 1.19]|uniref:fimbrial protein n=1 Tax=Pantoea sp. 1.19 TaxID=1925589 RepID=UPI000948C8CD|nr:fimbrial protein [Pantoea sp. 1.19]
MSTVVKVSAMAVLLAAFGASAADQGQGVVNFKGTVVDTPCGIAADSADQSIDFGQISKSTLAAGNPSDSKTLEIKLTKCDASTLTKGVSVTFTGNTISGDDGQGAAQPVENELATSGPTNTAVIINQGGNDIKFGTPTSYVPLSDGSNTLQYMTWVKQATGKTVAAGDFTAVANFSLNYQ